MKLDGFLEPEQTTQVLFKVRHRPTAFMSYRPQNNHKSQVLMHRVRVQTQHIGKID